MLLYTETDATLPSVIRRDESTMLPLLSEADSIRRIVLAHLALPYSVAEYGCGKKAAIIIGLLLGQGVPIWAMGRGLILERDLSPEALAEEDPDKRPSALIADNPLYRLGNLNDPTLRELLTTDFERVVIEDDDKLHAGPYILNHRPRVQFVMARSHVFPIIRFWDAEKMQVAERVVDLTMRENELFPPHEMRDCLGAPDALILRAPLFGRFRLLEHYLTDAQRKELKERLGGRSVDELDTTEHSKLVRELTGAEEDSIGDPETWTYANNIGSGDERHDEIRKSETGLGDALWPLTQDLLACRTERACDIGDRQAKLRMLIDRLELRRSVARDAAWARERLEPLAEVAIGLQYYQALQQVARTVREGGRLDAFLAEEGAELPLRGIGVRLRRRLDLAAHASENENGEIDARAFTHGFNRCAAETIRQMDAAGLHVCIDRAGNLHGLMISAAQRDALAAREITPRELTRRSVAFCSHIDTVLNAGKFDGRLGVFAGIEIAQIIHDLRQYFQLDFAPDDAPVHLLVTAFTNEEMTFTGENVSMSGSAAVAGRHAPDKIHWMVDRDGNRYRDRLVETLRHLRKEAEEGRLSFVNDFASDEPEKLLAACFEPAEFFTRHTYERHIEQGPVLDRRQAPVALVDRVMGIHQEDVTLRGRWAESAALELAVRLRELTARPEYEHTRITVGVIDPKSDVEQHGRPAFAMRCTLRGEMNHAGATETPDRRDPVVAAGRLAREARAWLEDRGVEGEPVVGDLSVFPGVNRNVIAESVTFTLAALTESPISPELARDAAAWLQGFTFGTLARDVEHGGEGMVEFNLEPSSFLSTAGEVCLSIDLRDAEEATIRRFRESIGRALDDLAGRYKLEHRRELQQQVAPYRLADTGQALLMERSYGGSHNPSETELTGDLVRGSALQLALAQDVVARETLDGVNLYDLVRSHIPRRWLDRMDGFTSGALHDTCNIAGRVLEGEPRAEIEIG